MCQNAKAVSLRVWSPGIIHGPLQSEDYARALLATYPGISDETVAARLAAGWNASGGCSRGTRWRGSSWTS